MNTELYQTKGKYQMTDTTVDLSLVSRPDFQAEVKTESKNRRGEKKKAIVTYTSEW